DLGPAAPLQLLQHARRDVVGQYPVAALRVPQRVEPRAAPEVEYQTPGGHRLGDERLEGGPRPEVDRVRGQQPIVPGRDAVVERGLILRAGHEPDTSDSGAASAVGCR